MRLRFLFANIIYIYVRTLYTKRDLCEYPFWRTCTMLGRAWLVFASLLNSKDHSRAYLSFWRSRFISRFSYQHPRWNRNARRFKQPGAILIRIFQRDLCLNRPHSQRAFAIEMCRWDETDWDQRITILIVCSSPLAPNEDSMKHHSLKAIGHWSSNNLVTGKAMSRTIFLGQRIDVKWRSINLLILKESSIHSSSVVSHSVSPMTFYPPRGQDRRCWYKQVW